MINFALPGKHEGWTGSLTRPRVSHPRATARPTVGQSINQRYATIMSHESATPGRHKKLALSFASNEALPVSRALNILDILAAMPPTDDVQPSGAMTNRQQRETAQIDAILEELDGCMPPWSKNRSRHQLNEQGLIRVDERS